MGWIDGSSLTRRPAPRREDPLAAGEHRGLRCGADRRCEQVGRPHGSRIDPRNDLRVLPP